MDTNLQLTPAQLCADSALQTHVRTGSTILFRCAPSLGRTTVLRHLHATLGGALLGIRDLLEELRQHSPAAIEESFLAMMERTLSTHGLVFVDDLNLLSDVTDGYNYPRSNLLDAVLSLLLEDAAASNRKLILATDLTSTTAVIDRRAHQVKLTELALGD